jgi:hypothetical protein
MIDDLYPPHTIAAGLAALVRRWPQAQSTSSDEPVFVLAAGWRSGSTLVQRALLSQCLVWGEPLGHGGLLEHLADPLRAVSDRWPEPHFLYRGQPAEQLAQRFIANLYPPMEHLVTAYLAWFEALFAQPARAAGKSRWGIKEVRLSADHATFLRWLYPRARLIFLIRNPYDAFRSYVARREQGWRWFHRWPTHPLTPELFGRHWRELAGSFLAAGQALGGLVVQYEQLPHGGWDQIRQYVGFELSETAIRSNPPDGGPRPVAALAPQDLAPLVAEVADLAEELGYAPPEANQPTGASYPTAPPAPTPSTTAYPPEGTDDSTKSSKNIQIPQPRPRPAQPADPDDPQRCAILVPVAERIEPACEAALRELERRGYRVWRVWGYRQIDLGRCQMASDALAAGYDETFWIDADTGFHPDAVERLRRHQLPIVCGIYPKKSKRELAIHVLPGTRELVFGEKGGLVEILYAATGFLLVRREVYETMRHRLDLPVCQADTGRTLVPYYAPLIRPDGDGWWYLADDFAFCHRARQCGYRIMADTSIRLWHLGSRAFSWEEAGCPTRRYSTYHFRLSDPSR